MLKRFLILLFVLGCSSQDVVSDPDAIGQVPVNENPTGDFSDVDSNAENSSNDSDEQDEDPNDAAEGTVRILFVGNSLTYFNDLPELVEVAARAQGQTVVTEMLAYPNYAILDYWDDGEVQGLIANGNFDFVVIQQGPSSQAFGREVLFSYGKKYSDLCNAHNAKLAFFMVWPSRTYYHTFDGVITNHREAAIATGSILCPVGEVWKNHFDTTGDFSYYGSDGFHPSLKGSQVAAEVIANTLF